MKEFDELVKIIEDEISDGAFPGGNFAIITKDVTYIGSVGNKALVPSVEKNDVDTLYDMASLSKVISTTMVAYKLMELGKLRTYTKVNKYLTRFKHDNVTIWNLMTHTSGLPEGVSGLLKLKNKDEVIDKIYELDLLYEPGSTIKYSDVGYILLGFICEKITGKTLDELAFEYVFNQLSMKDTCYNPQDIKRCAPTELRNDVFHQGIQRGDVHDETAFLLNGVAGSAGVFSTVSDVSNFIKMVLNDGVFEDREVFSKQTINLMYTPQVEEISGVAKLGTTRGLGWLIGGLGGPLGDLASQNTIHHTGFTGTSMWIDRTNEIGFCLLTNRVHPTRNNPKHMDARARISNYVIAHANKFKKIS